MICGRMFNAIGEPTICIILSGILSVGLPYFCQLVNLLHVQLYRLCSWKDLDDSQFWTIFVELREMGNRTRFIRFCLFCG
jgi:hypothetical protein